MKKLFLLFAFVSVLISCGGDDDVPEIQEQTNAEKEQALAAGSPWLFDDLSIIELTFNPAEKTTAEAYTIFKDAYHGSSFTFNSDHTGSMYLFEETYEFTWNLAPNGTKLTLDGVNDFAFLDISVSNNEFVFTFSETCQTIYNNGQQADLCVKARFTFK